jgi:hypothetical protein
LLSSLPDRSVSLISQIVKKFKSFDRRRQALTTVGVVGSLGSVGIFLIEPSFLTPDKLLVFAVFVGLLFGQAKQVFIRLAPFVALLLVYESFRGIVPGLNHRVNYTWMPEVDRWMFGSLPTETLQRWWWNGQTQWYDFVFYLPYMLHFVLPLGLAIVVWKTREHEYWRYVTAFVGISFAAFVIYLLFPAAPPWMSSNMGLIEPISRVSSSVWLSLGINDFPSLYSQIAANPVAAVPSLHAAYATLFTMFIIGFFKSRWRYVSLIYPVLIYVGTVYQGEHYVIDAILGVVLAVAGFYSSPYIARVFSLVWRHIQYLPALLLRKV